MFMSSIVEEVLSANRIYRENFGAKGLLGMPPARRFAILTCMDARLDPAKFAGLAEGDAHVIRNAGGRASDDAIRSLVISYKLLGTREWFVIHHTDCGMETFTDEIIRRLLSQSLEPAVIDSASRRHPRRGSLARAASGDRAPKTERGGLSTRANRSGARPRPRQGHLPS
jgi:carbonic anhydrase